MEMSDFLKVVGGKVRLRRKALGISQEKLAELANLHPTYISEIERGKVSASIYSFYQLAKVLETDFADLMNLPVNDVDIAFEKELSELLAAIRQTGKKQQKLFLLAAKGILSGIDSI